MMNLALPPLHPMACPRCNDPLEPQDFRGGVQKMAECFFCCKRWPLRQEPTGQWVVIYENAQRVPIHPWRPDPIDHHGA